MTVTAAELVAIDFFDGVPPEQLERWAAAAVERDYEPGEYVVRAGEGDVRFKLLLAGTLDGYVVRDGREERDHTHVAPTWIGAILALSGDPSSISLRAASPARLASFDGATFKALLWESPTAFVKTIHAVRTVAVRFEGRELQREKLAALGTMSAGLAHELNNPAAAALRTAGAIGEAIEQMTGVVGRFVESGMQREQAEQIVILQREAMARAAENGAAVDALAAADAEDAITELLERHGVPEPWRIAEPLAAAGLDEDWLDRLRDAAGPALEAALQLVSVSIGARGLVSELHDATQRMSTLVKAIKAYSYMDRDGLQEVDLHEGLEATLTILHHKLKRTAIAVERSYAPDLPRVCVYGSELNQVWTNLLDNAIGALGERGTIRVETALWGDGGVEVRIADDGPGVPPELQRRIFEPFFTTKPVGEGTGLGLDAARRIVEERHAGHLRLASAPGETVFTVQLPRAPRGAS